MLRTSSQYEVINVCRFNIFIGVIICFRSVKLLYCLECLVFCFSPIIPISFISKLLILIIPCNKFRNVIPN